MPLFYFKPEHGFPKWETKEAVEWLLKNEGKTCWAEVGRETGVRTDTQNRSLHKGFELIAKTLNDAGLDMRKVIKPEVDIPFTKESVKEFLWRPIQKAMFSKKSTTELDKVSEIDEVWEVLMRHLGEKHGIEYIEFPNKKHELDTNN